MRRTFVWLLVVCPVLSADPSADLQGPWRLTAIEAGDGLTPLPDPKPTLEIKGDRVIYGGEEIARLTADLAASPKIIDIKFAAASDKVYEGVYAVEKDTLKICLNGRPDRVQERPDGFKVEGQSARRLLTLERVKAEDVGPGSGFVGLALRFDSDKKEIVVDATFDDSPAAKAGLKKGDVVKEIGGTAATELRPAVDAVRRAKPKSDLLMKVRRGDKDEAITVRVGLLPLNLLIGLE